MKQIVDLELYQHIKTGWRRIAVLPDCSDEVHEVVKSHYSSNNFRIRLVTRIF